MRELRVYERVSAMVFVPVGAHVDQVGDRVVYGFGPQLDGHHIGLLTLLQRTDLVL
jgi:hypothetical protein